MTRLEVGAEAPTFCLPRPDGEEFCLEGRRGSYTIVYFYPRDGTPGCTREAKEFSERMDELERSGVIVYGISKDTPESHLRFAEKNDLTVTLLSDPSTETLQAYGAWGERKMYGKTFLGTVRSTFIIDPELRIAAAWYKVRVAGHVPKVISELEGLMNGPAKQ